MSCLRKNSGLLGRFPMGRPSCLLPILSLVLAFPHIALAERNVYVDQQATGLNDGTNWNDAYNNVEDAIADIMPGDRVRVAIGKYVPITSDPDPRKATFFIVPSAIQDVQFNGGFAGVLSAIPDERDIGKFPTILSGDLNGDDAQNFTNRSDNVYHVVTFQGTNTVFFDGFIIEGGYADGEGDDANGAGLRVLGGGKISGTIVQYNKALGRGGGIQNSNVSDSPESALVLDGVSIIQNEGGVAGGLWNGIDAKYTRIINSKFKFNKAVGNPSVPTGNGGAAVFQSGSPSVINCVVEGNRAVLGAGFMNFANLTVENTSFLRNVATSDFNEGIGGAVYTAFFEQTGRESGSMVMDKCTVAGNSGDNGGGITTFGGSASVRNSIVWSNTSNLIGNPEIKPFATDITVDFSDIKEWRGNGQGNIDRNPLLTADGHLRFDSPVINAGDPALTDTGQLDRDGDPIVFGASTDMGADEFRSTDGILPDYYVAILAGSANVAGVDVTPDGDPDGDGLTNLEEYELSSNQNQPKCVDPVNGNDANSGIGEQCFKTIRRAIEHPDTGDGDTILMRPGVYTGEGNRGLNFNGKNIILKSTDGAEVTTIDAQGMDRVFNFQSNESAGSALIGFRIENGFAADKGGGALLAEGNARPTMRDMVLSNNRAALNGEGNALQTRRGGIQMSNVSIEDTFGNTAGTSEVAAKFFASQLSVNGLFAITSGNVESTETRVDDGGDDSTIEIQGTWEAKLGDTEMRTSISGSGQVFVSSQSRFVLNGGDGEVMKEMNLANIAVDGEFVLKDALMMETQADLSLVQLNGTAQILSSQINLMQSSAGFGGKLAVDGDVVVEGNDIFSIGGRYFDLDSNAFAATRPMIGQNNISVFIPSTAALVSDGPVVNGGRTPPMYLEGRSTNEEETSSNVAGFCAEPPCPGHFPLPDSNGYSGTWALDSLEVQAGGSVLLTNRSGAFDFRQETGVGADVPEVFYVENLILGAGAILNTGLQTLFYKDLTMGADAKIQNFALHGQPLGAMLMESDQEFSVRVRTRLTDEADFDPACPSCAIPTGLIFRATSTVAGGLTTGVMDMRTSSFPLTSAQSVAAKIAFEHVAEKRVIIAFDYLINAAGRVVLSLSGNPDVGVDNEVIGEFWAPADGEPGLMSTGQYATYYASVPTYALNMTGGSYLEFELQGEFANVQIDNIRPQIKCVNEGIGLNVDGVLDNVDWRYALNSYGTSLQLTEDVPRWCNEPNVSDGYVEMTDMLIWSTLIAEAAQANATASSEAEATTGTAVPYRENQLLFAGKAANYQDVIYALNVDGLSVDETGQTIVDFNRFEPGANPPSRPIQQNYQGNLRLAIDRVGGVYQIHGTQGIYQLDGRLAFRYQTVEFNKWGVSLGRQQFSTAGSTSSGLPPLQYVVDRFDSGTGYAGVGVEDRSVTPPKEYPFAIAKIESIGDEGDWIVKDVFLPPTDSNASPRGAGVVNAEYIRTFTVLDDGRVFAIASDARNDNEWLLLWDRAADPIHPSRVQKKRFTDMEPELKSPTAMMVTRDMRSMYIASSQNEGDVPSTKIFRFAIDSPFGESLIMERDGLVRVENMQYVAQIIENNQDRTLYAIGFNGQRVERDVVFDLEDELQTEVTLAVIRPDDLVVTAAGISGGVDFRFPIDAVFTCDLGNCDSRCLSSDAVLAESDPVSKNRYLSFEPGNGGAQTAIRVVLSASDSFGGSVGEVRWLGPPAEFPDENSDDPTRMFTASALQCVPHFMDWGAAGVVHAYGASVVPGSEYVVEVVHDGCARSLSDDASFSEALTIATAKWGDVVAPFYVDGGPDQPDFTDIAALVDKFQSAPTSPSKSQAQLQPDVVRPGFPIDFQDIATDIDAFTGSGYPFEGPGSCN